jgi:hypothetical protein
MITIIGHSHVAAIQAAYEKLDTPHHEVRFAQLNSPEYKPLYSSGKVVLPSILMEEIERTKSCGGNFILSIGGAHHNVLGLTNHPIPFSITDYVEGKSHIPRTVFYDVMRHQLSWQLKIMHAVVESVHPEKFVQLQSPPPVDDDIYLMKAPGVYGEQMSEYGIAPARERFIIWRIQSDIFEQTTLSLGGQFVTAPKSMVADNGFLDRKAWRDPTHGNIHYGHAVLAQIQDFLNAPV